MLKENAKEDERKRAAINSMLGVLGEQKPQNIDKDADAMLGSLSSGSKSNDMLGALGNNPVPPSYATRQAQQLPQQQPEEVSKLAEAAKSTGRGLVRGVMFPFENAQLVSDVGTALSNKTLEMMGIEPSPEDKRSSGIGSVIDFGNRVKDAAVESMAPNAAIPTDWKEGIKDPNWIIANGPEAAMSILPNLVGGKYFLKTGGEALVKKLMDKTISKEAKIAAAKELSKGMAKVQMGIGIGQEMAGAQESYRSFLTKENEEPTIRGVSSVIATGVISGAIEGLTDKFHLSDVFGMLGKKAGKEVTGEAAKETSMKFITELGKDIAAGTLVEGSTEGLQQVIGNALQKIGYDPNTELTDGLMESIILGGTVGGAYGTVFRDHGGSKKVGDTKNAPAAAPAAAPGVSDKDAFVNPLVTLPSVADKMKAISRGDITKEQWDEYDKKDFTPEQIGRVNLKYEDDANKKIVDDILVNGKLPDEEEVKTPEPEITTPVSTRPNPLDSMKTNNDIIGAIRNGEITRDEWNDYKMRMKSEDGVMGMRQQDIIDADFYFSKKEMPKGGINDLKKPLGPNNRVTWDNIKPDDEVKLYQTSKENLWTTDPNKADTEFGLVSTDIRGLDLITDSKRGSDDNEFFFDQGIKNHYNMKSEGHVWPHAYIKDQDVIDDYNITMAKMQPDRDKRIEIRITPTESLPEHANTIKSIGKIFDKKIIFYDHLNDKAPIPDGIADSNRPEVIMMNSKAAKPHMFILGHEMIHTLKTEDPETYDYLEKTAVSLMNMDVYGKYRKKYNELTEKHGIPEMDNYQVVEEILADFSGNEFSDPKFWDMMYAKDKPKFWRIINAAKNVVGRVFKRIRGVQSSDFIFDDMNRMRQTITTVYKKYANRKLAKEPISKGSPKPEAINNNVEGSRSPGTASTEPSGLTPAAEPESPTAAAGTPSPGPSAGPTPGATSTETVRTTISTMNERVSKSRDWLAGGKERRVTTKGSEMTLWDRDPDTREFVRAEVIEMKGEASNEAMEKNWKNKNSKTDTSQKVSPTNKSGMTAKEKAAAVSNPSVGEKVTFGGITANITPEQKTKWDEIDATYQEEMKAAKKQYKKDDNKIQWVKAKKAASFKMFKQKRMAAPQFLTEDARKKLELRLKSNYVGKEVLYDGKEATVVGSFFGNIKIKMKDTGEVKKVRGDNLKSNEPEEITVEQANTEKPQDDKYGDVVDYILRDGEISINQIRSRMGVGYSRAKEIMTSLQNDGIVDTDGKLIVKSGKDINNLKKERKAENKKAEKEYDRTNSIDVSVDDAKSMSYQDMRELIKRGREEKRPIVILGGATNSTAVEHLGFKKVGSDAVFEPNMHVNNKKEFKKFFGGKSVGQKYTDAKPGMSTKITKIDEETIPVESTTDNYITVSEEDAMISTPEEFSIMVKWCRQNNKNLVINLSGKNDKYFEEVLGMDVEGDKAVFFRGKALLSVNAMEGRLKNWQKENKVSTSPDSDLTTKKKNPPPSSGEVDSDIVKNVSEMIDKNGPLTIEEIDKLLSNQDIKVKRETGPRRAKRVGENKVVDDFVKSKVEEVDDYIKATMERAAARNAKSKENEEITKLRGELKRNKEAQQKVNDLLGGDSSRVSESELNKYKFSTDFEKLDALISELGFIDPDIEFDVKESKKQEFKPVDTSSVAFKEWFGDSKITRGGEPAIVYHATDKAFEEFDKSKIGSSTNHATSGLGFFFSPHLERVTRYGDNIHEFYIKAENPYPMTLKQAQDIENVQQSKMLAAKLRNLGFDSIWIKEADYLVTFEPNQIKSATLNTGNFDPNDNRFKYSINPVDPHPQVQKRIEASRGIQVKGKLEKLKDRFNELGKSFTRTYTSLKPNEHGYLKNELRLIKNSDHYGAYKAWKDIYNIVGNMDENENVVFTMNLVLADIMKDATPDVNGYSLLEDGHLPFGFRTVAEVAESVRHFQNEARKSQKVMQALAKRKAMMRDIKQKLVKNKMLKKELAKDDAYFHHQVLEKMAMGDEYAFTPTTRGDVRITKRGWQKARSGSIQDYNTEYITSEFEVMSQAISAIEVYDRKENIREKYDKYHDLMDQVKNDPNVDNLSQVMPKGYVMWKPAPGSAWRKANTISAQAVENVLAGKLIDPDQIKKAYVKGQDEIWVIPEEVAKALDQAGEQEGKKGVMDIIQRQMVSGWKKWTLLNPFRVFRYTVNNISGDLDIAMAYDPRILKYTAAAMKDLAADMNSYGAKLPFNVNKFAGSTSQAVSDELQEAHKFDVIGSGFVMHEISDIQSEFKNMMGVKTNQAIKYWQRTKEATNFRENILRLAAYRYFKDRIAKGEIVYGASNPHEIDEMTNKNEIAAKLSRELIGDYGSLSKSGEWMRSNLIPFYSWIEINAPRYVKMMKNIKHEGNGTARIATNLTWRASKMGLKFLMFSAMVSMWNATFFGDEEDELSRDQKRQMHMILGRRSDGSIRYLPISGAFRDALSWFGGEDALYDIGDVMTGKKTVGTKLTESAVAPFEKLWFGTRPIFKTIGTVMTGTTDYPSILDPKPIRNNWDYVFKQFSLEIFSRRAMGLPTKSLADDFTQKLWYNVDPGESAYFHVRNLVNNFMEQQGEKGHRSAINDKSDALYNFKTALKYSDLKAADKYLNKYADEGGTWEGISASIQMSEPTGGLPKKYRNMFYSSLTADDKKKLDTASKWYRKTFTYNR